MSINQLSPVWAASGAKENPEDTEVGKTAQGWDPSERPAMEWENYIVNRDENKLNETIERVNALLEHLDPDTGVADLSIGTFKSAAGQPEIKIEGTGISYTDNAVGLDIVKTTKTKYSVDMSGYVEYDNGTFRVTDVIDTGLPFTTRIHNAVLVFSEGYFRFPCPVSLLVEIDGTWEISSMRGTSVTVGLTPDTAGVLYIEYDVS